VIRHLQQVEQHIRDLLADALLGCGINVRKPGLLRRLPLEDLRQFGRLDHEGRGQVLWRVETAASHAPPRSAAIRPAVHQGSSLSPFFRRILPATAAAPAPQNRAMSDPDTTWLLFDFSRPLLGCRVARHRRPRDGRHLTQHDCATTQPATRCSRETSRWSATAASPRCGPTPATAGPGWRQGLLDRGPRDNKQFKLSLLTDDGFDSLNYQASFAPDANWQTLHLPLADFRASFRGREVTGAPALDPARIRQVGLMIAARQAGPFALDIRRIGLA
jgi:hypothetical protein